MTPSTSDWKIQYRHLVAFWRRFKRWPESNEMFPTANALGAWCARRHTEFRKGHLSQDEMRCLIRIGFPLRLGVTYWDTETEARLRAEDPYLEIFLVHIERLKTFRQEHPTHWPASRGPEPYRTLGRWLVHTCEAERKGKLIPYRAALLQDLGYVFHNEKPSLWMTQYQAVKTAIEKHSEDWRTRLNAPLSKWVYRQRERMKKNDLSAEQEKLIQALGNAFQPLKPWNIHFEALKTYRKQHPDRWPELKEQFPPGVHLGRWCTQQRSRQGRNLLPQEYHEALTRLGFPWTPWLWDTAWAEQYQHLLTYRKKHPKDWPAQNTEFPKGNDLGRWLFVQVNRQRRGVLAPDRETRLAKLGVIFDSWREAQWNETLETLNQWLRQHPGRWPVDSAEDEEERRLGEWVTNQKQKERKGLLSAARKRSLLLLGLIWDPTSSRWIRFWQEVQAFRSKHRNQWPSSNAEEDHERHLGDWVERQRAAWRKGCLSAKQLGLLHQMGLPKPKMQ